MVELRDSIKNNWATTGQELTKDFRQFWQSSRPASPARTPTRERTEKEAGLTATSPSALSHLSHLEIPGRGTERGSSEFAAGYNLGLIGGVRAWVRISVRYLTLPRITELTQPRWHAAAAISTTAGRPALQTKTAQTSTANLHPLTDLAVAPANSRQKRWTCALRNFSLHLYHQASLRRFMKSILAAF